MKNTTITIPQQKLN